MREKLGICQWFHYQDHATVERAVELGHELGVRHLRTGISWADYFRPEGRAWTDWMMAQLADFEVLLSIWHVPPSISIGGTCAAPPANLKDYADFIDVVIDRYGDRFADLELWNEPNNRYKWDFPNHDPEWRQFGKMINMAAHWAQQRGRTTVLGGMIPIDHHWLDLMRQYGVLEWIDVVAVHGFPDMWWDDRPNWDWASHWQGWDRKIEYIAPHADGKPIWITETGLATVDLDSGRPARRGLQERRLRLAAAAPAERVYWYSLIDLDPAREAIEGFHADENEYHLGLVTWEGERKPAFWTMQELLAGDEAQVDPEPVRRRAGRR